MRSRRAIGSRVSVRSAGHLPSGRRARRGWSPAASVSRRLRRLRNRSRAAGTPTTLFYGARSGAELFYLEWFERLGVQLALATEDGSRGAAGRVTLPLERALSQTGADANVAIYACGPEPMLEAVSKLVARFGQRCEVSVERVMGCGLGGCYSCVVPVRDAARTSALRAVVHRRAGVRRRRYRLGLIGTW